MSYNPSYITTGLNGPTFLAFDTTGNLYVSNNTGNTVSKYDSSGTLLNATYITGLSGPRGIAFDTTGNLYVTNSTANTVSKYNSTGSVINANFITGLSGPIGIAFDTAGNLYIVNYNRSTVSKYNSTGTLVNATYITELSGPFGIAFDTTGNLYVANASTNTISQYDSTGSVINDNFITGLSVPIGIAFDTTGNLYVANNNNNNNSIGKYTFAPVVPCFAENTKILTVHGYVRIQDLRKGDLIKTSMDGFKAIDMIGKKEFSHAASTERIKDQLYAYSKDKFEEVFEDLVITGCHSVLVDDFKDDEREKTLELLGDIYVTEKKFRLPACIDNRSDVYDKPGKYTIYHLALENDNYYYNYGVYANGLLVETCSKRYLSELADMTLL